ncbi:hypothetical protein LINGRAHAP2_LOCUS29164, partial [Linum grandiflorum]
MRIRFPANYLTKIPKLNFTRKVESSLKGWSAINPDSIPIVNIRKSIH